jgi:hypothetical protein
MRLHNAPHMPLAHAQLGSNLCDGGFFFSHRAINNHARRLRSQYLRGILCRPRGRIQQRCQLRPAAQTRPKSSAFRLSRMGKKSAILPLGRLDATNRAAVNPRRCHRRKKLPIKTRIAAFQGEIASIVMWQIE